MSGSQVVVRDGATGGGGGGESRQLTSSSVSERIAVWSSLGNGSPVEREEQRDLTIRPRLQVHIPSVRTAHAGGGGGGSSMTAPAKTDLAPFPSAGRIRSRSASSGPHPEGGQSVMRHRHTQSVSSIHAPIPSPVYNARTQPIGLLSRSSSLSDSLSSSSRQPDPIRTAGASSTGAKAVLLRRSESLPTFPPREANESSLDKQRQNVSREELASLPANPKQWRPSQLSLYLSATLSLPPPLREDIKTFIISSSLSGRTFLHLREADLEEIGINILWRKALIKARDSLKREAYGGRTLWGFEGPTRRSGAQAPEQSRRLARDRYGADDSDGSTSEDEVAHCEEWKQSWRRLALERTGGRVRGLRQAFEDRQEEGGGDPQHWETKSEDQGLPIRRRVSFPSMASPIAGVHDQPTLYGDCETLRTVRPCFELVRSCADSPATVRLEQDDGDSGASPNFSPSPPRPSRNARAPIPFLIAGSVSSTARTSSISSRDCSLELADLAAESHLTKGTRRSPHSSKQAQEYSLNEQLAVTPEADKVWPSSACEGVGTGLAHDDQQEVDTVRASRSPRGAKFGKAAGQFRESLALDAIFGSPEASSSSSGQGPARASLSDGSPDGQEPPNLFARSEWEQGLQGDIDGEGTTRAKKGSLVLVRRSEIFALQLRMQEAEARLAETLVSSVQTARLTETTTKDTVVSAAHSSENNDPQQLSILEKRIKELEGDLDCSLDRSSSSDSALSETPHSGRQLLRNSTAGRAAAFRATASTQTTLSERQGARRRRPRVPSSVGDDDDVVSELDAAALAPHAGAWDVGRSGWPHVRIDDWKQLSGYVVAASIGIGIVVGEVIATKLLGLRRR